MDNPKIDIVEYSYKDYFDRKEIKGDKYGILEENHINTKMEALANNPYLTDFSLPLLLYVLVDDVIAGFDLCFPTRVYIEGQLFDCSGGSSLYVHENYRKLAIGAQILLYKRQNRVSDFAISAGISTMALPLQKKLKSHCFEFPLLWQPRKLTFLSQMMRLPKYLEFFLAGVLNVLLYPIITIPIFIAKLKTNKFTVTEVDSIPDWAIDAIKEDSYKYTEFHSKEWFDWVLNYNFEISKTDNQHLYLITYRDKNQGFFMIKERTQDVPEKNIRGVTFGTVCEWGIVKEAVLNEYDISRIAMTKYSRNVDIAEYTSSNLKVVGRIKKYLFFRHGNSNFAFKDYTKQYSDAAKPENWRYRRSFSDVMFY